MKNKYIDPCNPVLTKLKNSRTFKISRGMPLAICAAFAVLSLGAMKAHAVGAVTPFTTVEAETGTLGGGAAVETLTTAQRTSNLSSPALEASGHSYVQLTGTGQSVGLVNNTGQSITALNVRYCIPDSSGGGGITATLNVYVNGTFRQAITLSSAQTWCYEANIQTDGSSQTPSAGNPHIFWDEVHFFLNAPAVPAGATITFQKDSANTASFYYLDVVDLENPPGPLSQPANSLSIVTYGAVANNSSSDSTAAIQNCINAAQSQGKIVWVPSGTFYLNTPQASLSANGVTIQGAGMWYSTIFANPTLPDTSAQNILFPTSCTVQDIMFDGNARGVASGDGNGGGLNVKGNNWVINRVWIAHLGAGVWADGYNGQVLNCRLHNTWADGININNGNGGSGNNAGNNLTVSNCFVRGSGDDGFAINSGNNPGGLQMTNATVINCTSVAPWWANNIGIYGGVNSTVSGCLCNASVQEFGISVGQFGVTTGLPLQSGLVTGNTLVGCGDWNCQYALQIGQTATIANVTVSGNTINHAEYAGVGLLYFGNNVVVENNIINAPVTSGFLVQSGATGSPLIEDNAVQNLQSGQSAYVNNAGGSYTPTLTGNSWQSFTKKLVPGSTVSFKAMANGKYVTAANSTTALIANSTTVGQTQEYKVVDAGGGNIALQALSDNDYVCADSAGASPLIANRTSFGLWETYTELDAGSGNTGLRALANNEIVTADNAGANPLIANRNAVGSWETFTVGVITSAGVTFYPNANYGGTASQVLGVGTYTLSQLAALGCANDTASSARVPAGRTLIMYADDNFSGTSWTLTSDTPDFTTLSPNADNQVSSCKVQ